MAPPMMYEETGGIAFQATKIPNSNHHCCCLCCVSETSQISSLISFAVTEDVLSSVLISSLFCVVVPLFFVGTVLYVFAPNPRISLPLMIHIFTLPKLRTVADM